MKIVEDAMTDALARLRADATRDDVLRAIQQYDQLGPERFFSEHGRILPKLLARSAE